MLFLCKNSDSVLTRTDTSESAGGVDTRPPIVTQILVQTFVHINGTKFSGEPPAFTNWSIQALLAYSVILTRVRIAVLAVVTPLTTQLWWTLAMIVILQIDTLGAMQARARAAGVQVILTASAREAGRASAGIAGRCR